MYIYCDGLALVVAWLTQGILGAVLSHFVGTQDPEQVNMLAKQAGEVSLRSTVIIQHTQTQTQVKIYTSICECSAANRLNFIFSSLAS